MKNDTAKLQPFHVAVPVFDLNETLSFYTETLGCATGRKSEHWVDLDFFGHQFVLHLKPISEKINPHYNSVDHHDVPVPHYGVVLTWHDWHTLSESLQLKNIKFEIEPYIRFKGEVGEQATMFFFDPSGNALEFKAFKNPDNLFAH